MVWMLIEAPRNGHTRLHARKFAKLWLAEYKMLDRRMSCDISSIAYRVLRFATQFLITKNVTSYQLKVERIPTLRRLRTAVCLDSVQLSAVSVWVESGDFKLITNWFSLLGRMNYKVRYIPLLIPSIFLQILHSVATCDFWFEVT